MLKDIVKQKVSIEDIEDNAKAIRNVTILGYAKDKGKRVLIELMKSFCTSDKTGELNTMKKICNEISLSSILFYDIIILYKKEFQIIL